MNACSSLNLGRGYLFRDVAATATSTLRSAPSRRSWLNRSRASFRRSTMLISDAPPKNLEGGSSGLVPGKPTGRGAPTERPERGLTTLTGPGAHRGYNAVYDGRAFDARCRWGQRLCAGAFGSGRPRFHYERRAYDIQET